MTGTVFLFCAVGSLDRNPPWICGRHDHLPRAFRLQAQSIHRSGTQGDALGTQGDALGTQGDALETQGDALG
jgi:hypothetical protein